MQHQVLEELEYERVKVKNASKDDAILELQKQLAEKDTESKKLKEELAAANAFKNTIIAAATAATSL